MKNIFLLVALLMLVVISCSDENTVGPVEDITMEKSKPELTANTPSGKYPFMQEFRNINIIWQLEANDSLYIKIPNHIVYTITNEYFLELTYGTYTTMIYINKPNRAYFTLPYCGTTNLTNVRLMAIFINLTNNE